MRRMSDSVLRIRISRGTIALIQGASSLLTLLMTYGALRKPEQWLGVALAILLQVLVTIWLFSFSLVLAGDRLRYRSLFGGRKELRLVDIERIELQVGERKYSDKFRPPVRLFVQARKQSGHSSFDINMKVFDRADLEDLLEVFSREISDSPSPSSPW